MCLFTTAQETNTVKSPPFLQRLQTKEHPLRFNQATITSEKAFNGNHFRGEGNHEFSGNNKTLVWVFLQIYDLTLSQ